MPETDVAAQLCSNNVDLPVFAATPGLRRRAGASASPGGSGSRAMLVAACLGPPFRDSYLDLVRDGYGAEVGLADFAGNPGDSRSEINRWVAGRTEDRI